MDRLTPRVLLQFCLGLVSLLSTVFSVAEGEPTLSDDKSAGAPAAVVLSSGAKGGGYWNAGTRLQAVAAREVGLSVEYMASTGSQQNLDRLLDKNSPVSLGFAQADAAQLYLNTNPAVRENLVVLENIGPECVFIVTGADSPIRTGDDLQSAKDLRIGISSAGSGVAVTFDYMAGHLPELARARVVYGDTLAAMATMGSDNSTVDAVMAVHRPREHSPEVDQALAHPDRYRLVPLSDERLTGTLWDGKPIYRPMNLAMAELDEPLETVCVVGLLLANKHKLSSEQRIQLGKLTDYFWMQVYSTQ